MLGWFKRRWKEKELYSTCQLQLLALGVFSLHFFLGEDVQWSQLVTYSGALGG